MQPTITGNIINYDEKHTHTCYTVTLGHTQICSQMRSFHYQKIFFLFQVFHGACINGLIRQQ